MTRYNCMLALSLALTSAASAKPRLDLTFDNGQKIAGKSSATLVSEEGMSIRAVVDKGTRAEAAPSIVTQGCKSQPACLRVSLSPSAPGAIKNKIMFPVWPHQRKLPGGESGRVILGDKRSTTFSFDMKIDPNYDTPIHSLLHFQMVQPFTGKAGDFKVRPGGPILSLNIVPRSKRRLKDPQYEEFVVAVRNPGATKFETFDQKDPSVLYRGSLKKGVWVNFSFRFKSEMLAPDKMGGPIQFRQNGDLKFSKIAQWGFTPNKQGISKSVSLEIGAYRTPDTKGRQTAYFDNVIVDR